MGNSKFDGSKAYQNINAGLDEVYVLSLPSFVWFKVNYTSSDPRIWHTCNVVGNRQMLSIGGINPSAVDFPTARNETDPFWEGLKVFDLTTLQWTNYYNATAAPYTAPSIVAAHYAVGSRYPSTWSSNDVQSLFLTATSFLPTPTEPTEPTETSASVLPHSEGPHKTNRSTAVVGGAVGGVAAVVVVSSAYYLLARYRANTKTRERKMNKLPPMGVDGETDSGKSISQAQRVSAHEADSRPALPYEMSSGQMLSHEADSGRLYELSGRRGLDHSDVRGANSGYPHELSSHVDVPEADSRHLHELPTQRR